MAKQAMPQVTAWANEVRAVFGAEGMNAEIRKGNFYARENGIELGRKLDLSRAVSLDRMVFVRKPKAGAYRGR